MIWFVLGYAAGYALIAALLLYEFEEFVLGLDMPEPKSKGWRM